MIDALLGRVRLPAHAQLTIQTQDAPTSPDGRPTGPGQAVMSFTATGRGAGQHVNYQQVYPGQLLTSKMIMDLLGWLKHTARTFWGTESGGL